MRGRFRLRKKKRISTLLYRIYASKLAFLWGFLEDGRGGAGKTAVYSNPSLSAAW